MSKKKMPTIQAHQAKGIKIKAGIDELRKQWDHLDEQNYQTEKQLQISKQIGKAQGKLTKLTGEIY